MPIHNSDISEKFSQMADLLDIKGENKFRVRAYRNASQTIGSLSRSVARMVNSGEDLTELTGIGDDLAQKIQEIVNTGKLTQLEKLLETLPEGLLDVLTVEGLGPKRVKKLYTELDIGSLDQLEKAAAEGRIQEIDGFGEKTESKILKDLKTRSQQQERTMLAIAEQRVEPLVNYLNGVEEVSNVTVAGSYRRRKETVGDIDILATSDSPQPIMDRFVSYEDVKNTLSKGDTKSSVILRSGLQVDLRVVPPESTGAALHYFTGSQAHNVAIRERGVQRDKKINEYGIFRSKDEKRIGGQTEEEIFQAVDLPYIPPELRENRGEIQAAEEDKLPDLLSVEDIKGDLHSHTKATDGHYSLEEMAQAAEEKGHEYLAISDHSKRVTVANGMTADRLSKQMEEIDQFNEKHDGIKLLKSVEVDILGDGSLDLPDDVLQRLDICIAAVHSKFNLAEEKQTERIIQAMRNPNVDILAHPSGRMINEREPYEVDMERIVESAGKQGCFLELNSAPQRLDLTDTYCKLAKELGVKVVISTDSHRTDELNWIRFGVWQARRGWLEPQDVVNTRSWPEIKKILKK